MSDSYIKGYNAGYNRAKREIKKELSEGKAYQKGYKDALEYISGLLSVQSARINMKKDEKK